MGKEYVEEVTSNDILLTEKGRVKKSPAGNKQFRKIVQRTFRDHCSSSKVMLALHIAEKLKIFDPPMRLLQFDGEARKYYQCNDPIAFNIIQKVFTSFEPQDTHQTNATSHVAKKILNTKANSAYQQNQNSNPNRIVNTPKQRQRGITNRYPSHLALDLAIASPPIQPRDKETIWFSPSNTATLPPLPLKKDQVSMHKTSIPYNLGNDACREMELEWPTNRDEFIPKVYVEDDNRMEYDILYRGGRDAEIELASDAFRICLQKHFHHYQENKKDASAKRRFHMSVLHGLRQLNPEVRFLRYDKRKEKYYKWNHREAIDMILMEMEGRNKRNLIITPEKSKAAASASPSKCITPAPEESRFQHQNAESSNSSWLKCRKTTAATVEGMDVDERSRTQSTRITNILRSEDMNQPRNCLEKAIMWHRNLDSGIGSIKLGKEEDRIAAATPHNSTLPLTTTTQTTSNSEEKIRIEILPLAGSEMFPIEIDDDDEDRKNQEPGQSEMIPIEIDDDDDVDQDRKNQVPSQDRNHNNGVESESNDHEIFEDEYMMKRKSHIF